MYINMLIVLYYNIMYVNGEIDTTLLYVNILLSSEKGNVLTTEAKLALIQNINTLNSQSVP